MNLLKKLFGTKEKVSVIIGTELSGRGFGANRLNYDDLSSERKGLVDLHYNTNDINEKSRIMAELRNNFSDDLSKRGHKKFYVRIRMGDSTSKIERGTYKNDRYI